MTFSSFFGEKLEKQTIFNAKNRFFNLFLLKSTIYYFTAFSITTFPL
ncbi:MAG: hypothetical protein K0S33_841 [Bacteroidetes bacterium]|jgi:hypothetical protein|nr:hypothetical protein [Bacteroidota bacterium]